MEVQEADAVSDSTASLLFAKNDDANYDPMSEDIFETHLDSQLLEPPSCGSEAFPTPENSDSETQSFSPTPNKANTDLTEAILNKHLEYSQLMNKKMGFSGNMDMYLKPPGTNTCYSPRVIPKPKKLHGLTKTTKDNLLSWIELYASKNYGVYVQCGHCKKWRLLKEYEEPHQVPNFWGCSLNRDVTKNTCDAPEDKTDMEFDNVEFVPGSIVWAKMPTYPWWPAIVEDDPDIEEYYWKDEDTLKVEYHVTFLDKKPTRAWIPKDKMRLFLKKEKLPKLKDNLMSQKLLSAQNRALEAIEMKLSERLLKYSFAYNYTGVWPAVKLDDAEDASPRAEVQKLKKIRKRKMKIMHEETAAMKKTKKKKDLEYGENLDNNIVPINDPNIKAKVEIEKKKVKNGTIPMKNKEKAQMKKFVVPKGHNTVSNVESQENGMMSPLESAEIGNSDKSAIIGTFGMENSEFNKENIPPTVDGKAKVKRSKEKKKDGVMPKKIKEKTMTKKKFAVSKNEMNVSSESSNKQAIPGANKESSHGTDDNCETTKGIDKMDGATTKKKKKTLFKKKFFIKGNDSSTDIESFENGILSPLENVEIESSKDAKTKHQGIKKKNKEAIPKKLKEKTLKKKFFIPKGNGIMESSESGIISPLQSVEMGNSDKMTVGNIGSENSQLKFNEGVDKNSKTKDDIEKKKKLPKKPKDKAIMKKKLIVSIEDSEVISLLKKAKIESSNEHAKPPKETVPIDDNANTTKDEVKMNHEKSPEKKSAAKKKFVVPKAKFVPSVVEAPESEVIYPSERSEMEHSNLQEQDNPGVDKEAKEGAKGIEEPEMDEMDPSSNIETQMTEPAKKIEEVKEFGSPSIIPKDIHMVIMKEMEKTVVKAVVALPYLSDEIDTNMSPLGHNADSDGSEPFDFNY